MANKIPVITLDGAGSSGKGTLSLLLAKKLKWHFLDSGAIYRVLALASQKHHIPEDDQQALEALALKLDVKFVEEAGESARVILENTDVTDEIRSPECGNAASRIAVYPSVRLALLERQRAFRQSPGLVADGRDMGTVVFPDANFKIFLTATAEARAFRRYTQLQAKNISVSLNDILAELVERDRRDAERQAAPLKPAPDAWILDTTALSVDEAFSCIIQEVVNRRVDVV